MKNFRMILGLLVFVLVVSCGEDEEKAYLDMVNNSELLDEFYFQEEGRKIGIFGVERNYIFSHMYTNDVEGLVLKEYEIAGVYNISMPDETTFMVVIANTNNGLIYAYIGSAFWEYDEEFGYSDPIAKIKDTKTSNVKTSNSKGKTRLDKIKVPDFRYCSLKDVERLQKEIDSLSEDERIELSFLYLAIIGYIDSNGDYELIKYYEEVQEQGTHRQW